MEAAPQGTHPWYTQYVALVDGYNFLINAIQGLGSGEVAVAEQLILGGAAVDVPLFMTATGGVTARYSGVYQTLFGRGLLLDQPSDVESPHTIGWQVGGANMYAMGMDYQLEDFILMAVSDPHDPLEVGDLIRVNRDGLIRISPGCPAPSTNGGARVMIGGGYLCGDVALRLGGSYGKITALEQFGLSAYPATIGVVGAADAYFPGAIDYDFILKNSVLNCGFLFSCWPNDATHMAVRAGNITTYGTGYDNGLPSHRNLISSYTVGNSFGISLGYKTDENLAAFTSYFSAGPAGYAWIAFNGAAWVERMRIHTNGYFGVNVSAPAYQGNIVGGAAGAETIILGLRSNYTDVNTGTTLRFGNSTAESDNGSAEICALRTSANGNTDLIFRVAPGLAGALVGRFRIYADGGVVVGAAASPGADNLYVVGNCSALTFTDRTPHFEGDALAAIMGISGMGGEVDHASLPEFARQGADKRDLGAMVTLLTMAVQQQQAQIKNLHGKLN